MAKNNRKILRSVRVNNTVYKDGMEDELSAELNKGQIKRLTEKGVIAGFADGKTEVAAEEPFEIPSEAELGKMSKAKLVAVAEKAGVEVTPDSMTNKEIIATILEAE